MDEPVSREAVQAPAEVEGGRPEAPPPARRRPGRWVLRTLVLLIVCLGAYVVYERIVNGQHERGPRGAPPQSIRTAPVAQGDMPLTIDALGAVSSLATVTVQTQIAGQLQQIGFREGQMVKVGDFLAQIDPRPYQVALEQAQGTLAKDNAALSQAQADYARFQILNKQDSISRQQVEDQLFLVRQDQAAVVADQGAVDSAKLNLAYCRIVAPVAGRVGLRQVDVGNYLQPSASTGIVLITQLEPISVIFSIPEDDLPQVLTRLKADAKLPVTALDRSNTTQVATGVLDTTDNQIDTATGTVKLRASFANPDDALFPNQFVNARLLVDTMKNALLVPNSAIQRGAPGAFVYVVGKDDTVGITKVQTGPSDANNTVITSGLSLGQNVVIDGSDRLSDGAKVVVHNNDQASQAGPPTEQKPQRGRRRNGRGGGGGQ